MIKSWIIIEIFILVCIYVLLFIFFQTGCIILFWALCYFRGTLA